MAPALVGADEASIADETAGGLPLSVEQRAELHRRRAEHEADPTSAVP